MTQGLVTPVTAALTNPLTNDLGVNFKYCVTAFFFEITNRPGPPFPASRGLSRRGKMKREERDLACFQRVSYHACARVSLTTSDVFITTQRTGLNLNARSNFKWTNQSWGWNDLGAEIVQDSEESRGGEFQSKFFVLRESFGRQSTLIWSEIYWALWNVGFIAIRDFSFWGESDLWSDVRPGMESFPCYQRSLTTRQKLKFICSPSGDTQTYRAL